MQTNTIIQKFSGAFPCNDTDGSILSDNFYEQTGALTLSVSNGVPGGNALIPIKANGSAINVPGAWIKYGGDDISTVAGDVNHLMVLYKDADTIYYTNKVI